jgi:VIT1/CCC1 family predicted Fe2+/Mn2+ transporter
MKRNIVMASAFDKEAHFTASDTVRDVVIGMADGLTVPFALAAGISGAVDSISIIVTAGLAEIAAGAIAMGLGGYLAARTYEEHYSNERKRELYEVDFLTERERAETREIFREYGLGGAELESVVKNLERNKEKWIDFMMRYELNLEKPDPKRAPISAMTIGGSYIVGGLIPLSSYMLTDNINTALLTSIISTLTALAIFGAIKGKLTGINPIKGALQTMFVGGLAATVAYSIAHFIAG